MDAVLQLLIKYWKQLVLIVVLLLVVSFAYTTLVFRLTNTTPSVNSFPTSAKIVKFTFSQPIESVGKVSINGIEQNKASIVIVDNTVTIPIVESLKEDETVTFSVDSVQSKWFGFSLGQVRKDVTPRYIPFDQQSEELQKASIDASSSGQTDDKFLSRQFPLRTPEYSISASKAELGQQIFIDVTFNADIPDYDVSQSAAGLSDEQAESLRLKVLQTIKDNGGNPEEYSISYSNQYLNNKYLSAKADEHSDHDH